ncbi:hypothetical protein [Bacillus sp. CRN 9]|uniref:hypothetical protein n=1 Tax=Cytobacillus horneckiae TaxID=549687 RepID=UPI001561DCBA|nr:hypothetical protein [Bacillus sp. CRN 9]
MKKWVAFSFIALLFFTATTNILAKPLDNLPLTKSSKQWKVQIAEPDNEDKQSNISHNPDLYNFYSMDVTNINGNNVELVRVEAYRDHPGSTSEYELFTMDSESVKATEPIFHHSNFPLYTKATKLKVFVTWTLKNDKSIDKRKFRDQFTFELQ